MIAPAAAVVATAQYGNGLLMWSLLWDWGDDENGDVYVAEGYVTTAEGGAKDGLEDDSNSVRKQKAEWSLNSKLGWKYTVIPRVSKVSNRWNDNRWQSISINTIWYQFIDWYWQSMTNRWRRFVWLSIGFSIIDFHRLDTPGDTERQ